MKLNIKIPDAECMNERIRGQAVKGDFFNSFSIPNTQYDSHQIHGP